MSTATTDGAATHDVFVCHATEDKAAFVEPLVAALVGQGLTVWYDRFAIGLGDDFRRKMNEGLLGSRFGVVVVSPYSFKYWPQAELSALFNLEAQAGTDGTPRILPVRCNLTIAELSARDPLLAGRRSVGWEDGVDVIAHEIVERVRAQPAPTVGRSPLRNVPRLRAQAFVGRDEDLRRLDAALRPGARVGVAASIEGLAGVGKTELTLQLAHRLAPTARFPGGIFWFEAEDPDLRPTWGGAIADALGVPRGSLDERTATAIRIVASGGPALIVLDNVAAWTRTSQPGPLPSGAHIAVLVTTRHGNLGGQAFEHVAIECLAPGPARELLFAVAGRDLSREPGVDDLLAYFDGHTLALELAGAFLREFPAASPARYLERLRAGEPVEDKSRDQVGYERTVRQALDATCERLDDAARRALHIAGEFADEEASIALLEACGVDEDAQRALRRFHLLTSTAERWTMHRLVRAYARRVGTDDERAGARRAFVDGCVARAQLIDSVVGFRIYRMERPHCDRAIELAVTVLAAVPVTHTHLLRGVAVGAYSSGDLRRARDLSERALALALAHGGGDHRKVAGLRSDLAMVLIALGDFPRAGDLLEGALSSVLATSDEGHPNVAAIRSNLAWVLREAGDLQGARDLLELALTSSLANLGENHRGVVTYRSNLAAVLRDLGDFPRARDLLECALASVLANFDEDDPDVAAVRSSLAMVFMDLGDLQRARDLLGHALTSDLAGLREAHPTVGLRRLQLGAICEKDGDLVAGRAHFSAALATFERSLDPTHPWAALARVRLARVLFGLGETQRARAEARRAIEDVSSQPPGARDRVTVEKIAGPIVGEGDEAADPEPRRGV